MEILGNKLVYKTYGHTKVNDATINLPKVKPQVLPLESTGSFEDQPELEGYSHGAAQELSGLNRIRGNVHRKCQADRGQVRASQTARSTISDDFPQLLDTHDIIVEEEGKLGLILSYQDQGQVEKFRNPLIRITAKKAAKVNVHIIQKESKSMSLESVVILAEEKAKVRLR